MNLKEHYNKLYCDAIEKTKANKYQIDNLIDSPLDSRYGITLLTRPDTPVKNKIQEFLTKLRTLEPNQYFYPNTDLHITIMSIISCYSGFNLSKIDTENYKKIVLQSIAANSQKFTIHFKGLTASPSCIMVQGFIEDNSLASLRESLRLNFNTSNLEQSIDKRYAIQTAHSTIFRIRKPLLNTNTYISLLEEYKEHTFGSFTVNTLELVYNDWYQRDKKVQKLYTFPLY
ncbi:2'-5' RNA ligase [Maribacter vaceletii]|uniref:2'-5' RNA ligase n=1 Tax=Maribacter vaceletii TaxID=1206816 RepID=A0A495DTQ5_9FLAO|nr:mutarotase [Maribacter vaceletii]RKR07873.1 2'-5' RNA ligase [Maribacter vaceletii]